MPFDEWLGEAWNEHGDAPEAVFTRIPKGLEQCTESAQLPRLAALVVHVAAEHLGDPARGMLQLDALDQSPALQANPDATAALQRARAALEYFAGQHEEAAARLEANANPAWPAESAWVEMLATVSTAFANQGDYAQATKAFTSAIDKASYKPGPKDPASRRLAISGNNMACELEEAKQRSPEMVELMKLAAATAREWWAVAGDETNVLLAVVRLAYTHLAAKEGATALEHAQEAVRRAEAPDTLAGFRLQAQLALGQAQVLVGDMASARATTADVEATFARVPPEYQPEYTKEVAALKAAVDPSP